MEKMEKSMEIYQKAATKIALALNLEESNSHSQDWEYEVADSNRIGDFLEFYISNELNMAEKRILIKLLLESYNDYVEKKGFNSDYARKIKTILEKEKRLFEDIIQEWSCQEENLENSFYITPIIREIIKDDGLVI